MIFEHQKRNRYRCPGLKLSEKFFQGSPGGELSDLQELSTFYLAHAKYPDACSVYWLILDLQQALLGTSAHPDIVETLCSLGECYEYAGNYSLSEHFYLAGLKICNQTGVFSSEVLQKLRINLQRAALLQEELTCA